MSSISNFVSAVCEILNTNCESLVTDNANANVWSKSTLDIGDAWLTADPNDKDNTLQSDIAKVVKGDMTLDAFFALLTGKPGYPLNDWSMDLITQLQGAISNDTTDGDKDKIQGWNGIVSSYSSLIQSTKDQDTSTGDSENKACQSALQNASSAGQPATNAGDSIIGLLSNGSSVQAQISA